MGLGTCADGEGCKNCADFPNLGSSSPLFPHVKTLEEKTHGPTFVLRE